MENLYPELMKKASRLNQDINKLRNNGEYMCSCHLQDGFIAALDVLVATGMLDFAERSKIETELKARC